MPLAQHTHSINKRTPFRGPVGSLQHRCEQCFVPKGEGLQRCGGCRAVRYCSREHQLAHWPQHKSACNKTKKARAKLAAEEDQVRNASPDFMTPANAFETHVGHFWGVFHTRDYMRARFALAAVQLLSFGTLDGVSDALDHLLDMLRLCRSDNMGLRYLVPAIMLRLDLDQECYDFVKWWATRDPDGTYRWGDMTNPYLDIRDADVLEDPAFLLGEFPALNSNIAILMLKLKLLVDIANLKITRKILARTALPVKIRHQIERAVIRSPLSARFQKLPPGSLVKIEEELLDHTCKIGAAVVRGNGHYMFCLFDPDDALAQEPDLYSKGSWEEMVLAMRYSYATWWEMEGVLSLLKDARACAARDSDDEIENFMHVEKRKVRPSQRRTPEEMLEDVSVNRIWGYLDWAFENASYLGPWPERPSERHTREIREEVARMREEDGDEDSDMSSDEDEQAWSSGED